LDSYTPLPETLEAIKDLFCHPEDFSPDFPRVRARVRNQDTAGGRIDEWLNTANSKRIWYADPCWHHE
jgi:hypothetical protein